MHHIFSEAGFARVLRAGDSRRFGVDLKGERQKVVDAAISAANIEPIKYSDFFRAYIKGRPCISLKNYSQTLVLRTISRYLSRRFRLQARTRDSIVREVIETLGDATPMFILRRDIASFYESLPTDRVRYRLLYNMSIPSRVREFIRQFFETFSAAKKGLPRGIGLSAVISELAMQSIDQKIREIDGVYKYFRYADDILIFSFRDPSSLMAQLRTVLPGEMKFNRDKHQDIVVNCTQSKVAKTLDFEYLGYKFSFSDLCGDRYPREIEVSISSRKINRLKSKIICSLKSYKKAGDASLLVDRLKFLAGNYYAYRNGASSIRDSRYVRAGIHYNYSMCGIYRGAARLASGNSELKHLDGFYHSLLKSSKSTFSPLFSSFFKRPLLLQLEAISFFKGYEKRMMVYLQPERVQEIKAAWKNA